MFIRPKKQQESTLVTKQPKEQGKLFTHSENKNVVKPKALGGWEDEE